MGERPDIIGLVYGILFSPVATMKEIRDRPPLGAALGIFLVTSVVTGLLNIPALAQLGLSNAGLGVLGTVLMGVLLLLIGAAVVHLTAEFLGGQGKATTLLCLLALASLPEVFGAPLLVLGQTVPFLSIMGSFGLSIWVLVLSVIAIRETYGFSTGRAVASWLLPGILIFVAIIILAVIVSAILANSPILEEILQEFPGL